MVNPKEAAYMNDTKTKKYIVTLVPIKGTEWKGEFTVNIYPGKFEKDPITGKIYVPFDWKKVLTPGDGIVLDEKTYQYYTDKNRSLALVDRTLVHEPIPFDSPLYSKNHGDIIPNHVTKDSTWSIPAEKGTNIGIEPYKADLPSQ